MKIKKISLLVVGLLALFLVTVNADDGYDKTKLASQEYLNQLTGESLAKAIDQNDLTKLNLINNNKLAKALSSMSSLIKKDKIFKELDSRIKTADFRSILNQPQNSKIKEEWFNHYGVEDKGGQIKNYDGTFLTTAGTKGCKFPIKDVKGAQVLTTGELKLESSEKLSKTEIKIEKNNQGKIINYVVSNLDGKQGVVDISEVEDLSNFFTIKANCKLKYKSRTYQSKKDFEVEFLEGQTLAGKKEVRLRLTPKEKTPVDVYVGKRKLFTLQAKKIETSEFGLQFQGQGSYKIYDFIGGKLKTSISFSKDLVYTSYQKDCSKKSCIIYQYDVVTIVPKEDNRIKYYTNSKVPKRLNLDSIDQGTLEYMEANKKGKVFLTFTEKGLTKNKGDLNNLQPQVRQLFKDQGEEKELYIVDQTIIDQSESKVKRGTKKKSLAICPGKNCEEGVASIIVRNTKPGQKGVKFQVYSANQKKSEEGIIKSCPQGADCYAYRLDPKKVKNDEGVVVYSGHHVTGFTLPLVPMEHRNYLPSDLLQNINLKVWGDEGAIEIKNKGQAIVAYAGCNTVTSANKYFVEKMINKVDNPQARLIIGFDGRSPTPSNKKRWGEKYFTKLAKQAVEKGDQKSYKILGDQMIRSGTELAVDGKKQRNLAYLIKKDDSTWYLVNRDNPQGKPIIKSKHPIKKH